MGSQPFFDIIVFRLRRPAVDLTPGAGLDRYVGVKT